MATIYKYYCKLQEIIVGLGFVTIVALTFMNVILRKFFNSPIAITDSFCLLLFSWVAFLGADVALRYSRLVGMDILTNKMPIKIQKVLQVIVYFIMIGAFVVLAKYGYELCILNWARTYYTLPVSYGMATISLPVASVMMILTCCIKIVKVVTHFNDDSYDVRKDNDGAQLGEENMGADDLA